MNSLMRTVVLSALAVVSLLPTANAAGPCVREVMFSGADGEAKAPRVTACGKQFNGYGEDFLDLALDWALDTAPEVIDELPLPNSAKKGIKKAFANAVRRDPQRQTTGTLHLKTQRGYRICEATILRVCSNDDTQRVHGRYAYYLANWWEGTDDRGHFALTLSLPSKDSKVKLLVRASSAPGANFRRRCPRPHSNLKSGQVVTLNYSFAAAGVFPCD